MFSALIGRRLKCLTTTPALHKAENYFRAVSHAVAARHHRSSIAPADPECRNRHRSVPPPNPEIPDVRESATVIDHIGEGLGHQDGEPSFFRKSLEAGSDVDRRADDGEIQPTIGPYVAVGDVSDVDTYTVTKMRKPLA